MSSRLETAHSAALPLRVARGKAERIHDLLVRQARKTPERVAVVFEGRTLTYRELDEQSSQLAQFLLKKGIRPDDVVGLRIGRSLELIPALLGALKAGAAYVPLDPQYPEDRLAYMVEDSRAKIILLQEGLPPGTWGTAETVLFAQDASRRAWSGEPHDCPNTRATPRNLAHVLYTSGSTGRPKGVEIEHASVVNFLHSLRGLLDFGRNEIVVSVTGLTFDIAGLDIYLSLMTGAKLVLVTRPVVLDGTLLRKALESSRATLLQTTPVTWRSLLDSGWKAPQGFKALCGGERMPRQLLDDLSKQPVRLWNLYGPTETTIWSTVGELGSEEFSSNGPISVGRPIARTSIYVVDYAGKRVPGGESGEVCIGGDGLARGYRNQAELTRERFPRDPFASSKNARMYRTGDVGRIRPNGELEILGRGDHQIKYHGYRIEPGEIEFAIQRACGIKESMVAMRESGGEQRLVAFLVAERVPAGLSAALARVLPAYMVPEEFVPLPRFPQTPNGKVDRNALLRTL